MLVPFEPEKSQGLERVRRGHKEIEVSDWQTLTHTKAYLNWLANDLWIRWHCNKTDGRTELNDAAALLYTDFCFIQVLTACPSLCYGTS